MSTDYFPEALTGLVLTVEASQTATLVRQPEATVRISFATIADARLVLPAAPGQLRNVIRTGLCKTVPCQFAETSDGLILITNGIDPMLRWDGKAASAEVAGVPAPLTVCTLTIVGTHRERRSHVNGVMVVYDDPEAIESTIYATVRFLDRYGNVSDLAPISEGTVVNDYLSVTEVRYDDVPVPTGPNASKVVRRQVLRNNSGQASVFYVDVDTFDLTSTTLYGAIIPYTGAAYQDAVATLPHPSGGLGMNWEAYLTGNEVVPLFDDLGGIVANAHGFPPSWKTVTCAHLGRMFATGEVSYAVGHCEVTADSVTVQGVGTEWVEEFVGRTLYVPASSTSYLIAAVDEVAQTLTLETPYLASTDHFSFYAIRAPAFERRLVYFSPSGQPESWPATYAISVQEDGDEITGLMTQGSFLYILERRHIYRFTFKDDPAVDGGIFLTARRGCLTQRLWVQAEGTAYMFDELGCHAFVGGESQPISGPIQDLWRDDTESPLRINWNADPSFWSATYSEVHGTIRWFVSMTGSRYPRHALCFNYRDQRWWIEEYQRPVTACTQARLGVIRALTGVDHREIMALDVGWSDGARSPVGSTRGTVTSSTPLSVTDTAATFADELVNLSVFLTRGRGRGQHRRIVDVQGGTRLNVSRPWLVAPDESTEYIVAGIPWDWLSGWWRVDDEIETSNRRDVEVVFQSMISPDFANLQLFYDHSTEPRVWASNRDEGALVTAGRSEVELDLKDSPGWAMFRQEGHSERFAMSDQYLSVRLSGVQEGEPVRIYRVTALGMNAEG